MSLEALDMRSYLCAHTTFTETSHLICHAKGKEPDVGSPPLGQDGSLKPVGNRCLEIFSSFWYVIAKNDVCHP